MYDPLDQDDIDTLEQLVDEDGKMCINQRFIKITNLSKKILPS